MFCRRLTVPLTGSGEATLGKLMKDDKAYTFSELPRINPHHKVSPLWPHLIRLSVSV